MAKSDVHYVSKKGNDTFPYTTPETAAQVIQDAVFAATDGDTVLINDGVYKTGGAMAPGETLMSRVMVTNSIIIKSVNGAKKTVIIGKAKKIIKVPMLWIPPDRTNNIRGIYALTNIQIIGFTIKKGGANESGLEYIHDVGWIYTPETMGGGVYAKNKATITDCIFLRNLAFDGAAAIHFNSFGIVSNCIIKRNFSYADSDVGVAVHSNTNLTMHNCEIIGNNAETIITCQGGIISDSTFSKNKIGYEGLRIYNGIITNCHITKNYDGSGQWMNEILVCNNSTIVNCLFDKNKDTVLSAVNSIIKDCKFYKNKNTKEIRQGSWSGLLFINARSILTNCTFTRNYYSAGVSCSGFSTAINCNISNNRMHGMEALDLWESIAINCNITNNRSTEIGKEAMIFGTATRLHNSEMYNCLIANNFGYAHNPDYKDIEMNFGGGVYCSGSSKIYNCTIVANKIKHGIGGGIYFKDYDSEWDDIPANTYTGVVYNSIISFNKAKKDPQVGGRNYKLINCYTAEEPDFVDYKNGDYHLKSTSPCIEAGTNMGWMAGTTDLDGNPRTTGEKVDLGAYENR